jgi:preprotein translocase subunit SecA
MTDLQRFAAQPRQQGLTKAIHKAYMLSRSMDYILERGETDIIEWEDGEMELWKRYSDLYLRLVERMAKRYSEYKLAQRS